MTFDLDIHFVPFYLCQSAEKLERINGEANVIESDVSATNGVVHFIDRILTDVLF